MKVFNHALTEPLGNTNFMIDDFDGFGVEEEGSDITQWYTWYTVYGDEKTNPSETEYSKMME